jgi:hypothetical protein
MSREIFVKSLDQLHIIALFTLIIDGTKLSVAISDVFLGHLQNLDSVMKRGKYIFSKIKNGLISTAA